MDLTKIEKLSDYKWRISPTGAMKVPAIIFGSEQLLQEMDEKVLEQISNVTMLPGIVGSACVMPDGHWGYGFPIGGVAAFNAYAGGIISAGGVGFDISCGVRCLITNVDRQHLDLYKESLAETLFTTIPAGMGSKGAIKLDEEEMRAMLLGGAKWAVQEGFGYPEDLNFIEEYGCMDGAEPDYVSKKAFDRQRNEMGTLGSGNHYLEVQEVDKIFDPRIAEIFGLSEGKIVLSIHCGSRGLGHQIGTDFLREMVIEAPKMAIQLPDLELGCAPINSDLGKRYLGAMRAGINCALANRQIITHLAREAFLKIMPQSELALLYDVSHNTCKEEEHTIEGKMLKVFVHRKGATRALGPNHQGLPEKYKKTGQPVLLGGTMGTASYILAGKESSETEAFNSASHGAGRRISRHEAIKHWKGRDVIRNLLHKGIIVKSPSRRGVAEEAPKAYKDIEDIVLATEGAGLAKRVARLKPVICIKG